MLLFGNNGYANAASMLRYTYIARLVFIVFRQIPGQQVHLCIGNNSFLPNVQSSTTISFQFHSTRYVTPAVEIASFYNLKLIVGLVRNYTFVTTDKCALYLSTIS